MDPSAFVASLPSATVSDLRRRVAVSDRTIDAELRELGLNKLGQRLKVLAVLRALEGTASAPAGAATDKACGNAQPGPPRRPRVAFVCHTGYFVGGSFGGATRASLAMIKQARRVCGIPADGGGIDVIACVQLPVPEGLVFKLEGGRLGRLDWEGETILVGRPAVLTAALRAQHYDAVIALSIEMPILELALGLRASVRYATPHNYYLPPFGPFRRYPVREGHAELLLKMDALLSPCQHHCKFLQRWGPPGLVTRPLYAADYHYFHEPSTIDEPRPPHLHSTVDHTAEGVTLPTPPPPRGPEAPTSAAAPSPAAATATAAATAAAAIAVATGWRAAPAETAADTDNTDTDVSLVVASKTLHLLTLLLLGEALGRVAEAPVLVNRRARGQTYLSQLNSARYSPKGRVGGGWGMGGVMVRGREAWGVYAGLM